MKKRYNNILRVLLTTHHHLYLRLNVNTLFEYSYNYIMVTTL